jgi:hypothetical protein
MSNIPIARSHLRTALVFLFEQNASGAAREIESALSRMKREQPVRKATGHRECITWDVRRQIHHLSRTFPDMTMHEIATQVGLRSVGRVSEILNRLK